MKKMNNMIGSSQQTEAIMLHQLIFDLLLVTDGRTTDLLETLLNEKMVVNVIRQEQINDTQIDQQKESSGASHYIRESILVSEKSQIIVSHNFALVSEKNVPSALFEKIAHQHEGIGKTMRSIGLHSFRDVMDYGHIFEHEAVDLFHHSIKLRFSTNSMKIPYKKYSIHFDQKSGIQMLEYFNPELIYFRLNRSATKISEGSVMSDKSKKEQKELEKQLYKEEKEREKEKEQKRKEKQAKKDEKQSAKQEEISGTEESDDN